MMMVMIEAVWHVGGNMLQSGAAAHTGVH